MEIRPVEEKVAQPAAPPAEETTRLVVEALVEEKFVVVAWVVVERVMLLKMCAPVQVGEKAWSTVKVGCAPIT